VKRILVPLDGSPLSEAIIPLAETLARDYEADIVLVRALRTLNSAEAEVKAQEEAEAYLRAIAAGIEARGRRVEWKVWYDEPDRALADAARFNGVDLVTMTTHGRGGLSRLMFGSVAESLVRVAPVPVLLVRGQLSWQPGGLGKIVVPLDGSELSEAILPTVERLAGPFHLGIELVRAVEPLPAYAAAEVSTARSEEMIALEESDAEQYLQKVASPLEAKGLRVRRSIGRGLAVDVILRRAEEAGAGLIAMSTHGRTGVGRLLVGSVAERVLHSSPVPVLLWKAPVPGRTDRPAAR
jgi:nucleotide-binding universal stress UspA family protein